ncbi:RraA family protein [Actinoalloteichus hymeniacidonis]|uniref:Putative 4-hydroxy-4-methyl-2-oxoglutarate aldolase n=1 Tax=Actinoalloteichus hymeniacidonis TaxID=340345 RepID=A0AAC9HVJ2_9PSEU|nr:methyltransferase [Actinoalloteichus hymeniacidonis]AOS65936.1 Demethylmenaquinone methyltransferase [Actinoalloteichus hymeniacidonis]MBB5905968.1 regulator of RNase E activity RraA [Actinoalloteichus hymeniacidonis]
MTLLPTGQDAPDLDESPVPNPATLAALAEIATATVGDAMGRFGILHSRIQSIWPGAKLAGRAFTVWTRGGDNLYIHRALDLAFPGDVIVVNGFSDDTRALIGELIGEKAKARGIAGFVLDGAARDAADLQELGVPVFARSITPAGPFKDGPGVLGGTIAVGGVAVAPGDIVLGDADGVAVVPLAEAEAVLERARAILVNEEGKRAANQAGKPRTRP